MIYILHSYLSILLPSKHTKPIKYNAISYISFSILVSCSIFKNIFQLVYEIRNVNDDIVSFCHNHRMNNVLPELGP